jgi:glycosyltransferase involved in cell wall biosynthesis
LRDRDARARMGQAGFQRAFTRFSAERMVRETAAVYEEVVAARRHR